MKKIINISLVVVAAVSVVLLFWPFAQWNDIVSVILRIIPSFTIQVLLCRTGKYNIVKAIPAAITGIFALWGLYLYFTSSHWSNAVFGDLIADYISPFICCIIVFSIYLIINRKSKLER